MILSFSRYVFSDSHSVELKFLCPLLVLWVSQPENSSFFPEGGTSDGVVWKWYSILPWGRAEIGTQLYWLLTVWTRKTCLPNKELRTRNSGDGEAFPPTRRCRVLLHFTVVNFHVSILYIFEILVAKLFFFFFLQKTVRFLHIVLLSPWKKDCVQ